MVDNESHNRNYPFSREWSFDGDGALVHYDEWADLSWDPGVPLRTATEDLFYDLEGRLSQTTWSKDGQPYSAATYAYDPSLTTASVDYAAWPGMVDEVWRWTYDAAGRPATWGYVSEVIGAEAHWLTYDDRGRLVEDRSYQFFLWPTWWCERWSYDGADRPVRMQANNHCGGEEEGYFVYDYAYDPSGNQTLWEWTDHLGYPFERWTWRYDDQGRRTERLVEKTYYFDGPDYQPVQRDTWTYEEDVPCDAEAPDEEELRRSTGPVRAQRDTVPAGHGSCGPTQPGASLIPPARAGAPSGFSSVGERVAPSRRAR